MKNQDMVRIDVPNETAIEIFNHRLEEMKANSELAIATQDDLVRASGVKLDFENYVRSVENYFEPELAPAEEKVKRLKLQISQLVTPVKGWLKALVDKQREFTAEEKRKAQADQIRRQQEQDRLKLQKAEDEKREADKAAAETRRQKVGEINRDLAAGRIGKREAARLLKEAGAEEEAAKQTAAAVAEEAKNAPAPTVRVVPSIPSVPGFKNQTYYYAELTDGGARIHADYLAAVLNNDQARQKLLMRFILVNEGEISKYARERKDSDAVMRELPGVKAYSKG
jgi:hypothetical protein